MKKLRTKKINLSTGGPLIAILHYKDAEDLDLNQLDRINIKYKNRTIAASLNIVKGSEIKKGQIGLFKEAIDLLKVQGRKVVRINPEQSPKALDSIKKKLEGEELSKKEVYEIIKSLTQNELTEVELSYFVAACYNNGLNNEETLYLTKAIVEYGQKIKFNKRKIADKHCIGGIPNNRTSLIIIPILAAAGITIPKSSSRAISSPSGTADTMEVLANVSLNPKRIKSIVKKTNACIVWEKSLGTTSSDNKLIKVRYPFSLDPNGLMISSILSKKYSMGSTHVLLDIPIGKTAKIQTKKQAKELSKMFKFISKKLGIKAKTIFTDGTQPVGNGIGPNLEARDALYILRRDKRAPKDLEEKSVKMANILLKMCKQKAKAKKTLNSGLAYKKMKEIIKQQGGNPNINPDNLKLGEHKFHFRASRPGKIKEINNKLIAKITRVTGCPGDKKAGIYFYKKVKDKVKKGQIIFTIHSENKEKLEYSKTFVKNSVIIN